MNTPENSAGKTGKIMLVGLGPGSNDHLTARAEPGSAPVAQRRDDAPGSPFFRLPCFGEAKKGDSPAGARPGLPRKQFAKAFDRLRPNGRGLTKPQPAT